MSHRISRQPLILLAALSLLLPVSAARADDGAAGGALVDEPGSTWGFGARVRQHRISKRLQKVFLADTPGPITQVGGGVELSWRRHDQLEVVIGLGYDSLDGNDGYYLDAGGNPSVSGDVDFIEFRDLSWLTAEVTVVGNLELHELLGLRYGVGLGLGYVRGEMRQSDAVCSGDDIQRDCAVDPNGEQVDEPADIPPALPVINALIGLQLRPFEFMAINVDAGMHSVPYIGGGVTFYLR